MTTAILYPILCATFWYLASQAKITQWLWSRYPKWLDRYLSCAACVGFLFGVACSALGWWQDWPFLGISGRWWMTPLLVGLCAIFWTPLLARWHVESLYTLGGIGLPRTQGTQGPQEPQEEPDGQQEEP